MKLFLTLICIFSYQFLLAQTAQDNKEILIPINDLFKGMNTGDSALVHSTFTSSPTIVTVFKNKDGVPEIKSGQLQSFLVAVGTPHDIKWSEPIWDVKIQMDGNLAQVWAKYAFYLGKDFSIVALMHFSCSKDRMASGESSTLQIQKEGCNVPPAIANSIK